MDWKLELVAILVSDVDRAKAFYTEVGFNADHDHTVSDEIRFVQLTPPGSASSIALGTGIVDTPPGSVHGMQMVVSDIEAARGELAERGVKVSEVQDFPWGSFVFWHGQRARRRAVPAGQLGPPLVPAGLGRRPTGLVHLPRRSDRPTDSDRPPLHSPRTAGGRRGPRHLRGIDGDLATPCASHRAHVGRGARRTDPFRGRDDRSGRRMHLRFRRPVAEGCHVPVRAGSRSDLPASGWGSS
jgi:predicted enzyme related to lactoylglutathione lyase